MTEINWHDKIYYQLLDSSESYFKIGINTFHRARLLSDPNFQASIGNLSISIELLLKATIAQLCPKFLYPKLPLEFDLKLSYPSSLHPLNSLQFRELENFSFGSQGINECIAIFYLLFPEEKKTLKSYFSFLSVARNESVHFVIYNFRRHDLERIGYLNIYLINFLSSKTIISQNRFKLERQDTKFFEKFDAIRNDRVQKAIQQATQNAKNLLNVVKRNFPTDWENRSVTCPICQSDALLTGYCKFEYQEAYDGADAFLSFIVESFECSGCRLKLLDPVELALAGIETDFDLSEYIPEYLEEHPEEYSEDS